MRSLPQHSPACALALLAACHRPPAAEPTCVTAPDRSAASACMAGVEALPEALAELACFTEREGLLEPDPTLVPYDVAAPLFSDFADKQRFAWLPPDSELASADGALALPRGGALFKHFSREGIPIETRVILHGADGLAYGSYVWEDGSARLSTTGESVLLPLEAGEEVWAVPSAEACTFCHGADQPLLGFAPDQLAREVCVDGELVDQLAAFAAWDLGTVSAGQPLVSPTGDGPLEARARSDLHANCAHCHRRGGWAVDIDLDLRFQTALADTRLCNVPNQYFAGTEAPATRLVPGDPDASSVLWRMETDTESRMPPVGTHADPHGTALLRTWIAELASCP